MKTIIAILFTFFTMFANGQGLSPQVRELNEIPDTILKNLNKMGIDTSDILNKNESEFLNFIFKSKSQGFDFANKKIGFIKICGEIGKKPYFEMQKKHILNKDEPWDNGYLYIFNEHQKMESGGYDAAIVYWSKYVIPTEKVVERLAKYKKGKKKEKHKIK